MMKHRNSQKRFVGEDYVYFVTSKTQDNFPYFREPIFCELWIDKVKEVKKLKDFDLYAFCLLHDHFHIIFNPNGKYNISQIIHSLKRNFSRDANKLILSNEGEVSEPRRGTPSTSSFGEDRNHRLQIMRDKFMKKYGSPQHKIPPFKWQCSFHDHVIRNQNDFDAHMDYTLFNHLKHGLPKNWKWTSLNYDEMFD